MNEYDLITLAYDQIAARLERYTGQPAEVAAYAAAEFDLAALTAYVLAQGYASLADALSGKSPTNAATAPADYLVVLFERGAVAEWRYLPAVVAQQAVAEWTQAKAEVGAGPWPTYLVHSTEEGGGREAWAFPLDVARMRAAYQDVNGPNVSPAWPEICGAFTVEDIQELRPDWDNATIRRFLADRQSEAEEQTGQAAMAALENVLGEWETTQPELTADDADAPSRATLYLDWVRDVIARPPSPAPITVTFITTAELLAFLAAHTELAVTAYYKDATGRHDFTLFLAADGVHCGCDGVDSVVTPATFQQQHAAHTWCIEQVDGAPWLTPATPPADTFHLAGGCPECGSHDLQVSGQRAWATYESYADGALTCQDTGDQPGDWQGPITVKCNACDWENQYAAVVTDNALTRYEAILNYRGSDVWVVYAASPEQAVELVVEKWRNGETAAVPEAEDIESVEIHPNASAYPQSAQAMARAARPTAAEYLAVCIEDGAVVDWQRLPATDVRRTLAGWTGETAFDNGEYLVCSGESRDAWAFPLNTPTAPAVPVAPVILWCKQCDTVSLATGAPRCDEHGYSCPECGSDGDAVRVYSLAEARQWAAELCAPDNSAWGHLLAARVQILLDEVDHGRA